MLSRTRLIQDFIRYASIDSTSLQERKLADLLKEELIELGFNITEDQAGSRIGGNCGNIYGFLKGELEGEPILFSAHMDTVEPGRGKKAVILEDGTIKSDGTTVLGADDISGLVSILEAVRVIREQELPHRSIEVLFTVAEEIYIQGSKAFDYSIIKASEAYVLDIDGPVGTAALKAPTLVSFTAKIIGKASHAGFAPEQGINAVKLAAEAITGIEQGRIDEETTVNIGLIEGGKARNIVPEECILKGEVRSLSHEKALTVAGNIEAVIKNITSHNKASYEFDTSFGCLAYEVGKEQHVVKQFERACEALNYPIQFIETFGGSDNNNFQLHEITGIVLACGMNKVHSCEEYTHIDELERCCNIVIKLMTMKD